MAHFVSAWDAKPYSLTCTLIIYDNEDQQSPERNMQLPYLMRVL